MKYNIEGFFQPALINLGFDAVDAIILRWFVDFQNSGNMETIIHLDQIYYWINYSYILQEIPVIKIKNARSLARRLKRFCSIGLFAVQERKRHAKTKMYYRIIPETYKPLVSKQVDTVLLSTVSRTQKEGESESHKTLESGVNDSHKTFESTSHRTQKSPDHNTIDHNTINNKDVVVQKNSFSQQKVVSLAQTWGVEEKFIWDVMSKHEKTAEDMSKLFQYAQSQGAKNIEKYSESCIRQGYFDNKQKGGGGEFRPPQFRSKEQRQNSRLAALQSIEPAILAKENAHEHNDIQEDTPEQRSLNIERIKALSPFKCVSYARKVTGREQRDRDRLKQQQQQLLSQSKC